MDFQDEDEDEVDVEVQQEGTKVQSKTSVLKKPGGTFAKLGLMGPVLKAVHKKGYKLATPIQRKCIPVIMGGRDLVAMARTGSGKTAAFLLPIIDKLYKLKIRQPKSEIRALILSPTRELAKQTFKFAVTFSKNSNLTTKLMTGGRTLAKDFHTITSGPDILVATPGRLFHVLMDSGLKLNGVEVVVFDEADQLFEHGYKDTEQVYGICQGLPDSKQTLLFSATIPQKLADFAKAGLKNPAFVRLDVESNLSETLKSIHLHCSHQDKFAVLMHLLKNFVKKDQMTLVFMPSNHHIEYCKMLLDNARLDCSLVYGTMDPEARKINIEKFQRKKCRIMLTTDLAARGIDIPLLDIVINFNFPFKPKLYIHKVGRVARAGRFGCAISLVSHDETPYLHALHNFLGLSIMTASNLSTNLSQPKDLNSLPDKVLGTVPQNIIDDENDILKRWHEHNEDLKAMVKVCDNAMKPYLKSREPPEPFSVKAAKDIHKSAIGFHPLFRMMAPTEVGDEVEKVKEEANLLDRIKAYKPQVTIFEVGHIKGNRRTEAFEVMQKKRQYHDKASKKRKLANSDNDDDDDDDDGDYEGKAESDGDAKQNAESVVRKGFEDSKFYLKYQPDDYVREKGLELDKSSFNNDLKRATLDLVADDVDGMKRQRNQMVWDRKKKKYTKAGDDEKKVKKIRTESGAYISASYKTGLFEKWKKQTKFEQKEEADDDYDGGAKVNDKRRHSGIGKLRAKLNPPKKARRELKNLDEMMKERNIKEKREAILRIKTQHKARRNAERASRGRGKAK